jgi:hypothetical protein
LRGTDDAELRICQREKQEAFEWPEELCPEIQTSPSRIKRALVDYHHATAFTAFEATPSTPLNNCNSAT